MKKLFYFLIVLSLISCASGGAGTVPYDPSARALFAGDNISELRSFLLLKADFHVHTVYSVGSIQPTARLDEAHREGLDVISITDHVEGYPRGSYASSSRNTPYNLALGSERADDIIVIRGSGIARPMPPGHFNAIFLTDSDELDKPDYISAIGAAKNQNAFIFWNHPGLEQPETLWWPEHSQLFDQGMMHGIEIANGDIYFPEAHQWALEKNLTMIGGSGANAALRPASGSHRTMTLVFARDRTPEAIYEALMEKRTAVYMNHFVIGNELYLREIVERSFEISVAGTTDIVEITIKNNSDFIFHLKKDDHDPRMTYFRNVNIVPYTIRPNATNTIEVRLNGNIRGGDVNFIIENFLVGPNIPMKYTIRI